MSKMSTLNLELQEQANKLGFSTVQEALDNGYEVDYFWNSSDADDFGTHPELVYLGEDDAPRLNKPIDMQKELGEAHEAWLKEKEEVLEGLDIVVHSDTVPFEHKEIVKDAIEFIKKGEV